MWSGNGKGCPERCWTHHPWRCFRGIWIWHWVVWISGLRFTVVVLGGWCDRMTLEVYSKLGFCHSVILWNWFLSLLASQVFHKLAVEGRAFLGTSMGKGPQDSPRSWWRWNSWGWSIIHSSRAWKAGTVGHGMSSGEDECGLKAQQMRRGGWVSQREPPEVQQRCLKMSLSPK